ncbi:hypothetical protein CAEBREN_13848 [Caenorhabditis brenneri]|uniref:Uncharacterized protein n=1 Tax=Caenorhabditis brenneri TaxID=135651 RepID=G0NKU2_CAEBE|nr:hypothetical protein CAEBREN_13848 [Caenorhabditis brenneri]
MYIKLTCIKPDGTKTVEYLEYNKKLFDATKYMFNYFFGGRKHPVSSRNLRITCSGGVLRLPESIRISSGTIYMGTNVGSVMSSLKNVLVREKYDQFGVVEGLLEKLDANHPVIQSAEEFVIIEPILTGNFFHMVLNNTHSKFCLHNGQLSREEYEMLINKMIGDKRAVETTYFFDIASKILAEQVLNDVKRREGVIPYIIAGNGCSKFKQTYFLPIDDSSYLTVCCDRNPDFDGKDSDEKPWTLWLRVESKNPPCFEDSKEKYAEVVDKIISRGSAVIGWCISIDIRNKNIVKDILKDFKSRNGATSTVQSKRGCSKFPYTYSVPIDQKTQVTLYCNRNKNLNRKNVFNTWTLWYHVERNSLENGEITKKEYKQFIHYILKGKDSNTSFKTKIGTKHAVLAQTKETARKLLEEVKQLDGVTVKNQLEGLPEFPYTLIVPINDSTKLTIFCCRENNYNKDKFVNAPFILWHCVGEVVEKSALSVLNGNNNL